MSVGNPFLDEQHQVLITIVNWMIYCVNEPEWDETVIFRHLHAFEILFVDHLRTEEKLLEHRGYPLFEEHVQSHEEYENEVVWLIHRDNSSREDYKALLLSLTEWLVKHITTVDKSYAEYLS